MPPAVRPVRGPRRFSGHPEAHGPGAAPRRALPQSPTDGVDLPHTNGVLRASPASIAGGERSPPVLVEVLCDVVYVLAGVYGLSRGEIHRSLTGLLKVDSVAVPDLDVVLHALQCYRDRNLDMVDCLLLAYREVRGHHVHTFDRKLERLLASSTD